MRADELKRVTAWLWKYRRDLAQLPWQDQVDELETLLALAAWRSQPLGVRAAALCDALDLNRPSRGSELGATRRGWSTDGDEDYAGNATVSEWGHCG